MGEALGADKDGNEVELSELLGTDPDIVPEAAETAIESRRAMTIMGRVLDERERNVICLRYGLTDGEPYPQHEVARRLGISRSYVSRIEKKALQKLREALGHTL
jgi:RNA polymerase sporulation-specific sigma factor